LALDARIGFFQGSSFRRPLQGLQVGMQVSVVKLQGGVAENANYQDKEYG
jgi:hypothetical protein